MWPSLLQPSPEREAVSLGCNSTPEARDSRLLLQVSFDVDNENPTPLRGVGIRSSVSLSLLQLSVPSMRFLRQKKGMLWRRAKSVFSPIRILSLTLRQLPTHELLITLYARLARDQHQASDSSGQAWLKSPQYKVDFAHHSREHLV